MRPDPYTDCMIDLEGLGDTPDAAPCSIGVAFFDLDRPGRELLGGYSEICPISVSEIGLRASQSTIAWWKKKDIPVPGSGGGASIDAVLTQLCAAFLLNGAEDVRVWSRGNSYDLAILKIAFSRLQIPVPWQHWRERDVRTWLDAYDAERRGNNPHHALEDAITQVRALHDAHSTPVHDCHGAVVARTYRFPKCRLPDTKDLQTPFQPGELHAASTRPLHG